MTATHPVREDIDLLDGHWYANEPHDLWEWMRDNAPVYYDERRDVWGVTRHADVLRIEKDPKTFSSKFSPRPHGQGLPMMISMDDPLHTRRRRLVYAGFTPKRVRDKEPVIRKLCTQIIDARLRARRMRLRVGHRRAAAVAPHRRHARLPARVLRRSARVVRRPHQGHHRHAHRRDDAEVGGGGDGVPRVPARRHRRPSRQATAGRSRQHPLSRGDRGREARRRVAGPGDAADPHRRRRDHASRHQHGDARADGPPRPARDPRRGRRRDR